MLVAVGITALVVGIAFGILRMSRVSTEHTLGPQLGLQTASRTALVDLVRELQESIEVVRPPQGASLTYFVVRDKLNQIMVGYLEENAKATAKAGRKIHDFFLDRTGWGEPKRDRRKLLFDNVERLTVTTLSPGLLQIHADFHEQGRTYAFLTTVRTRNINSDADL
jgi:hypothetical protein